MKNRSVFFTTIAFVIILIILGFGIYSALAPIKTITSDIIFNFKDSTLNVAVEGEADWAPTGNSDKYFSASSTTAGLTKESWTIPNIVFVTSENPQEEVKVAVIKLAISNKNISYDAKVTITGVAVDKDNLGRFTSQVVFINASTLVPISSFDISSTTQQVSQNIAKALTEDDINAKVLIEIRYTLEKTYSDIDVSQNLIVTLETNQ